ncbi:MAG: radical SAM peptide maturase, CXXX-repeat target family [Clostridiales bacterium]|nr:radical SAM peptide maturase, CXXX-repeat target family [Clostridiales bacterium]
MIPNILMGKTPESWKPNSKIKYITFNVTEDCNLACTYCYFTHKNNKVKMNYETAKKAVDFILNDESLLIYDGVVWDFIGGEPTLEMQLIDQLCDYILIQMYKLHHKWFYCYRFMLGTNGVLYTSESVQNFVRKHAVNLHVNITIDGNKAKHDLSRIKKDGSGSYDDVIKALPLWFAQAGGISTKATFAHDDLPYLKDSIVNLWNLGIKYVMANVVFENVWEENDEAVFEKELRALADYVIDNRLWDKCSVRFFSPNLGRSYAENDMLINFCGSGNMLAIAPDGKFFPCVRFLDSSLNNRKGRSIGNITEGFDYDRIRAFNALTMYNQSADECIDCPVSCECTWCTGNNYDNADHDTIFQRKTYHCKLHKANVRATKYFWDRYEKATGNISPMRYNLYFGKGRNQKYLNIMADANICYCHEYESLPNQTNALALSDELLQKAVDFCDENFYIPVFLNFKEKKHYGFYINDFRDFSVKDEFNMDIVDAELVHLTPNYRLAHTIILRIKCQDIANLPNYITYFSKISRVVVVIRDLYRMTIEDLKKYKVSLYQLQEWLYQQWASQNFIQINVVSDDLFMDQHRYCTSGKQEFTLAPDGKIYTCPSFYIYGQSCVGDIENGINQLPDSLNKEPPMCGKCVAYHCKNCKFLNKIKTDEFCVPFELECIKSNIEAEVSETLKQKILKNEFPIPFDINIDTGCNTYDPLVRLRGDSFMRKYRELEI